jgi:hypothetical protein
VTDGSLAVVSCEVAISRLGCDEVICFIRAIRGSKNALRPARSFLAVEQNRANARDTS